MPLRARLVLVLLALHLASSLGAGAMTWWWLERKVEEDRLARVEAIARVADRFPITEAMATSIGELTGTRFRVVAPDAQPRAGAALVRSGAAVIEIRPPEGEWRRIGAATLVAALVFLAGGAVLFAGAAWWTARTVAELEDAARRQERLAVLGTFTATIAHEVRNPLSAIRLAVQMQRRSGGADPGLALVEEEIERLDLVVDGLLSFARGMRVDPAPCELHAVADSVLRLLRRQGSHAGVALERIGEAHVVADAQRLRQLLLNLVLNAIQAQPEGGAVQVEIRPDGLAVRDRGPGVAPALVPRLFAAFASGKREGTGLGLHLAWSIARAHGAELRYEAAAGGGAVFVLSGLKTA